MIYMELGTSAFYMCVCMNAGTLVYIPMNDGLDHARDSKPIAPEWKLVRGTGELTLSDIRKQEYLSSARRAGSISSLRTAICQLEQTSLKQAHSRQNSAGKLCHVLKYSHLPFILCLLDRASLW